MITEVSRRRHALSLAPRRRRRCRADALIRPATRLMRMGVGGRWAGDGGQGHADLEDRVDLRRHLHLIGVRVKVRLTLG